MRSGSLALCLLGLLLPRVPLSAQEPDTTGPRPEFGQYEPSPAFPFGRPNPQAPPELSDFAFLVGAFECTERIRRPDGEWVTFAARWNAKYFRDGHGIKDQYWSPAFNTSNIGLFDSDEGVTSGWMSSCRRVGEKG